MKNREIVEKILSYHPHIPNYHGCDSWKAGDPEAECTGIVTALVPTVNVIRKARALGANLLIVHEPTFYTSQDGPGWFEDFPNRVYAEKRQLLEESGIAIWRDHDHMHFHQADSIFTGVLKGVNCGLHLIHKGFRRLLEGTVDDHQLHGSAHGQLAIGSRRIHGIQPRLDFLGHTGKAADPSVGSRGRDQLGRVQIAVPNPIYLHTAHAGNGVHLFQIIRTVAAEGLGVQAIHVTLSENIGIFFILTGDHHGGNGTGFKPVHILNGNHRSGVVITGFTSGFTGDFIFTTSTVSRNIIVQFSNGKAGVHGKVQGGWCNAQLQHGGACRLRFQPPFCRPQNEIRAGCGVCKGFIQHRIKGNIKVLQFHGGGGVTAPNQRTFTGVQIAIDGKRLLKHPGKDCFIGLCFIHQISTPNSALISPKMLTTVKVVSTFFLFTVNSKF